jgi:sigma-B regulation protein RsbU (phosphoserine phosphatase)
VNLANRWTGEQDTASKVVVLLVDDQAIIAEAVGRMFAEEPDIQLHYCSDPTAAIETAIEVKPTVILQDLVMPEIDGLTLVRFYRAHEATRDIPLIVLSTKEEPKVKAEAFGLGANDYLVKLPDKLELTARVRYHSRGYTALQQRNAAFQALARELAEAAEYVRSLLPAEEDQLPRTRWRYIPSDQLGGDSFGYHWIDDDHFAIYLLDVCGHGVGAALLGVSVTNVLRTQSLSKTDFRDPAQVLAALNQAFPMESNNNMFFTIWYGVFQRSERRLRYASGGHPPALLLNGESSEDATAEPLTTSGFLIGAMPGTEYRNADVQLGPFCGLFIFSDGTYEITKQPGGDLWTLEEWLALLTQHGRHPPATLDLLVSHVRELQGRDRFDDDFSLLQVILQQPSNPLDTNG